MPIEEYQEDSKRCLNIARSALTMGNIIKAERLVLKSDRLYPNDDAKAFLIVVKAAKDDKENASNTNRENDFKRNSKTENKKIDFSSAADKDDAEKCIKVALKAIKAGDLEKAKRFLEKAEMRYPTEHAKELLKQVTGEGPKKPGSNESSRYNKLYYYKENNKDVLEICIDKAQDAFDAGDYNKAIRFLNRSEQFGDDIRVKNLMAQVLAAKDNDDANGTKVKLVSQKGRKHESCSKETRNELYRELVLLERCAIISNSEVFECGVCMDECAIGQGVVLRECLHTFCKECLASLVQVCEEPTASCPDTGCPGTLHEREVRAVASPEDYEKWLARGLATAESGIRSAYHCRTRDCIGWADCDPDVQNFPCPVCKVINCLPCEAIHEGDTCEQYKEKLQASAKLEQQQTEQKASREMLDKAIKEGTAMRCPECNAVIFKDLGCDWIVCSGCKTGICWATRGRRWGPRGIGDTSGGCRCGINGRPCHPQCRNCH